MSSEDHDRAPREARTALAAQTRDIAEVGAVEIITTAAVHLMSAAAVAVGLADHLADDLADGPADEPGAGGLTDSAGHADLDEARKLITALAGLITAAAPDLGSMHARSLRDGLRSLQLAFREASLVPDEPGAGPGEKWTGPVLPSTPSPPPAPASA